MDVYHYHTCSSFIPSLIQQVHTEHGHADGEEGTIQETKANQTWADHALNEPMIWWSNSTIFALEVSEKASHLTDEQTNAQRD